MAMYCGVSWAQSKLGLGDMAVEMCPPVEIWQYGFHRGSSLLYNQASQGNMEEERETVNTKQEEEASIRLGVICTF